MYTINFTFYYTVYFIIKNLFYEMKQGTNVGSSLMYTEITLNIRQGRFDGNCTYYFDNAVMHAEPLEIQKSGCSSVLR